jgi:hypothetical protein
MNSPKPQSPHGKPTGACFRTSERLLYNHAITAGAMSVALTNTEKQARYRERHLGVDGEKARVGLILNASTRAQMGRLARYRGYTITALIEELVGSAERQVTARLSGKGLKAYYATNDASSR